MSDSFRTRRRVEFRDTDAAGIMHFSVFFTMMEQAEHELLRSIGLSVMHTSDPDALSWPRVSASCDYKSSVRFEDELDISVTVHRIGEKSIQYRHEFKHSDRLVAMGEMTTVCCRFDAERKLSSVEIPQNIRDKFAPLVAT